MKCLGQNSYKPCRTARLSRRSIEGDRSQASDGVGRACHHSNTTPLLPTLRISCLRHSRAGAFAPSEARSHARHDNVRHRFRSQTSLNWTAAGIQLFGAEVPKSWILGDSSCRGHSRLVHGRARVLNKQHNNVSVNERSQQGGQLYLGGRRGKSGILELVPGWSSTSGAYLQRYIMQRAVSRSSERRACGPLSRPLSGVVYRPRRGT